MPPVLAEFVEKCRTAAATDEARRTIVGLLNDLVSDPAALAGVVPTTPHDDVTADGLVLGADVMLYEDDTVTVILVDTLPGVVQPPHDHRMTAMIGVFVGCEEQRFFARTSEGITPAPGRQLAAGEVITIGTDGIHAISTPDPLSRAVHVYLGRLATVERSLFDPDTFEERPLSMDLYHSFCRTG